MEAGNWRKGLDLKLLLTENPEQFDFFQAVKIIEQLEQRLAGPHSGSGIRVRNIKFSISSYIETKNAYKNYQ